MFEAAHVNIHLLVKAEAEASAGKGRYSFGSPVLKVLDLKLPTGRSGGMLPWLTVAMIARIVHAIASTR